MNYEKDVKIDIQNLEQEWLNQPDLAIKYGKEWVIAKKKVALLEEKVKVIRSSLTKKVWDNPQKCVGQPKANVQLAESYYRDHKKHKKAKQELIEAQEELDLIEVARGAIVFQKKDALENEVKLFIAGYFAGPPIPKDLNKVDFSKKTEEQRIDSVKHLNKKNKKSKKKK